MSRQFFFAIVAVLLTAATGLAQAQTTGGTFQTHLHAAQDDLGKQRPDLAIPEFEAALAIDPNDTDAQANLGVLRYFGKDYARAEPHLRLALKSSPNLYKLQALLGLAELRLSELPAAQADLESALLHLRGEKVQLEVGNALIDTYTAAGDLDKAASVIAVLLDANPTDSRLLLLSYRLHADLAAKSLLTLAIAAPNSAEMHLAMARELARQGADSSAVINYREALRINPLLPGVHAEFGNLLFRSTDEKLQAEAEAQFEAAIAQNPRDEKAQLMLGKVESKKGHLESALQADTLAVELQPNDPSACAELAKILLALKQPDKARTLLVHAIELDPTDEIAHYRLGTLDRQQGKADDAKHEFAEYEKYKAMKARLQGVFDTMRVHLDNKPEADAAPR
jgi:cytochrome c-type biogenesis protein CcmH/NrfG